MAVNKSALVTIYHVVDGPRQMYEIDANHALRFPEWRREPSFTQDDRDKYLKAQVDAANEKAELTQDPADRQIAARLARENEAKAKQLAEQPPPPPAQSVVDIPDGWQDLSAIQRINLAAKLGAERKGLTAAKADEVIQAEVDRRESEVESVPAKPADAPTGAQPNVK